MCCSAVLLAGGVDERCPRSASRYFLGTLNVQCVPHPLFMQSNAENPLFGGVEEGGDAANPLYGGGDGASGDVQPLGLRWAGQAAMQLDRSSLLGGAPFGCLHCHSTTL